MHHGKTVSVGVEEEREREREMDRQTLKGRRDTFIMSVTPSSVSSLRADVPYLFTCEVYQ
jgi:hypothetical protein